MVVHSGYVNTNYYGHLHVTLYAFVVVKNYFLSNSLSSGFLFTHSLFPSMSSYNNYTEPNKKLDIVVIC